jgi:hypothetical protein
MVPLGAMSRFCSLRLTAGPESFHSLVSVQAWILCGSLLRHTEHTERGPPLVAASRKGFLLKPLVGEADSFRLWAGAVGVAFAPYTACAGLGLL